MIIFLYGQDTYRSRKKLNEIIDHYKRIHKSGLNLKRIDFKKVGYTDFRDEIQSVSMFAGKKLIILENAISNENFKTNFIKNSKSFFNSKDIILFYETNKLPEKDKLLKSLKKHGKLQEFKLLKEEELKDWAKKEFINYHAKIEPRVLERLIYFIGNDLWRFSNEIKKLIAYKKNPSYAKVSTFNKLSADKPDDRQDIKMQDVDLLVRSRIETDIFKTIDAIAVKDKRNALYLIRQHLEKGDSPLYLLSMVNFQFRNILLMKSLQYWTPAILKKIGIHPYVAKKSISQANRFSLEELKKIYQRVFQLDLAIKTGRIEAQIALELLIAEI